MKRSANVLFPAVLALGALPAPQAAETGDVDGDGRLTIADLLHLEDHLEPAEGSLAGLEEFPCYAGQDFSRDPGSYMPTTIYLESLRRGIDGSLPHWDSVWPALFTDSAPLDCEDAADADDNGALNITDPILLLGVLFGGGGELPAPATCGADPTADTLGCAEGCSAG